MKERVQRMRAWKNGERPGPWGLEIAPTLRCNLDCPFCWREGVKDIDYSNELPLSKYYEILDQAAELDVREIKIIGGGESTLRPDTVDIMCGIKERGMSGYICTNGTLFKESDIKRIVEAGFDHLKMSFHGHNAELVDYLMAQKDSFKRQVRNLQRITHYKKLFGMEKPFVELGLVLVNRNFRHLVDVVRLGAELGVNALFIEPVTIYSEVGAQLKMTDVEREEFGTIAAEACDVAKDLGLDTNIHNYIDWQMVEHTGEMQKVIFKNAQEAEKDSFLSSPCFEPFLRMGIRSKGEVGPCGFLHEASQANLNDSSLSEIWYGPYFDGLRKRMLSKNLLPQCARCCSTLVVNNRDLRRQFKAAEGSHPLQMNIVEVSG